MGRPSKFDSAFKAKVAIEALQEKEPTGSTGQEVQRSTIRHHKLERGAAKELIKSI